MQLMEHLINKAIVDGALDLKEHQHHYALVTKGFGGLVVTMAEIDKVDVQKMQRSPA